MPPDVPASPAALTPALLDWISGARRDLPWRSERLPYRVWISEIMLQQTQVATVVPYFERWMARFPDIAALAEAPLDDVLKAWEGLGYYARARNLHAAAQRIMTEHGGQLPADPKALLDLPGIGRYTAGAILSLAFGQAEPILDGNVRRVLCRIYDVAEDPRKPAVASRLWDMARALVEAAPRGQAGDLNEALMELGALICTPGVPDCPACPVAAWCLARERGVQTERPVATAARRAPHYDAVAAVVRDAAGRYLIAQRPPSGLLGGLWEFPGTRTEPLPVGQEDLDGLRKVLAEAVTQKLGIRVAPGRRICQVRHAYTHFKITLHAFETELRDGEPQPDGYTAIAWATPAEMASYALPITDQKIVMQLEHNRDV